MLKLSLAAVSQCKITLPKNQELMVKGANGKIDLIKPMNGYNLNITNGVVDIVPVKDQKYNYQLYVEHGRFKAPEGDPGGLLAKVSIVNGKIRFKDKVEDDDVDIDIDIDVDVE